VFSGELETTVVVERFSFQAFLFFRFINFFLEVPENRYLHSNP